MANVVKRWKKGVWVGCSHGLHLQESTAKEVLGFISRWKPHTVCHLGDAIDTAAFRSGASGTPDQACPVAPDVDAGMEFLASIRDASPSIQRMDYLCGNHEDRLWRLMASPNAVVAYAATEVVRAIEAKCRRLKANLSTYSGIWQSVMYGPYRAMHGVMFGENAIRDHAEAFGPVIHAHTHRPGVAKGRRSDNPTAYCVGTLAEVEVDYAKTRRSTTAWAAGMLFGEYCETDAALWLIEKNRNTEWRLPL